MNYPVYTQQVKEAIELVATIRVEGYKSCSYNESEWDYEGGKLKGKVCTSKEVSDIALKLLSGFVISKEDNPELYKAIQLLGGKNCNRHASILTISGLYSFGECLMFCCDVPQITISGEKLDYFELAKALNGKTIDF